MSVPSDEVMKEEGGWSYCIQ